MGFSTPANPDAHYRIRIGAQTEAQLRRAIECADRYPLDIEASFETLTGSVTGRGADLVQWAQYFDQVDLLARGWNLPTLPG